MITLFIQYLTHHTCLKVAQNALAGLKSFLKMVKIIWSVGTSSLHIIQQTEGFELGNKFSTKHLQFQKSKMTVSLAAQTLSSSVADAIDFLCSSMKLQEFQNSESIMKFIWTIVRLFDLLNSRSPLGFQTSITPRNKKNMGTNSHRISTLPAQPKAKQWSLKPLVDHKRKNFIIGFVATIKSTIQMTNEMFYSTNPFKYLLIYKFSQDHIQLLFSCIRSMGG